MRKLLNRIANPFMKVLLRSPFHGIASGSVLLLSFAGCRSGKHYILPVSYVRVGSNLIVVSDRERMWWRNLRGGVPVTVYLQGQRRQAHATIALEPDGTAAQWLPYLEQNAGLTRQLGLAKQPASQLTPAAISNVIQRRVMLQIQLV